MKIDRNILVCAFYGAIVLVLLLAGGGCSSTITPPQSKAPRLTFEDIQPLPVNAAVIDIANQYDPAADQKDVSSLYPVQPDIVLRRYAEKRLAAAGTSGTLRFVIENARIYYTQEPPDNQVSEWLQTGGYDRYEVMIQVRLAFIPEGGIMGSNSSLQTFRRAASIPASDSIAARESAQIGLIEQMMSDIDREVSSVISEKMALVVQGGSPDPAAASAGSAKPFVEEILAAPELR